MKKSSRDSVGNRFTWSRWSLAAILAAGLSVASSPAVLADDLDAAITVLPTSSWAFPQMAQVYTALRPGQLYQISLDAGSGYTAVPVTIAVTTLKNGVPSSTALATLDAQTPFSGPSQNLYWRTYTLNPRVQVTAGTKYAIVTSAGMFGSLGNYFHWGYSPISNANFPGGSMLVRYSAGGTWFPLGTSSWGFDFKTWVSTSTGPQVGHDNAAGATATEGTAPTTTGTYSGSGGTITLQADHGTVTPASGTGGAWTWTGAVYDEDSAPISATITATDAAGAVATTTFPVKVYGTKPTARISTGGLQRAATLATATASTPEGSSLTLNASATAPDPADQAGVFTYEWTGTKNGSPLAPTYGPSYIVATTDEDTFVLYMTATDDGGMASDRVSIAVVGTEIQPTPTITSITGSDPTLTFVAPQETLNFAGTTGDLAPETHTYRWDFGDGAFATTPNASHAYANGGTYAVTLTVTDDAGAAGTATATVKVLTTQQALAAMIAYVDAIKTLNPGQRNGLIAKLNAASDSVARGDNKAAGNELNAFLNELEADLKTGKISPAAYNALRADAHALQGALGTYNRFLEWWPLPA